MMACFWTSRSFRDTDVDICLSQADAVFDTVATANEGILKDHLGSLSDMVGLHDFSNITFGIGRFYL